MKKILLFGGSFDPIHYGHINLALDACKELNIKKCYFLLAKNARWKDSSEPKFRLEMLKLALKPYKSLKVSLVEYNSKEEINRTYDTMVKFGNFDKVEYYYLIGSDQLEKLNDWYNIDELSKMVHFVVFRRPGTPLSIENMEKYGVRLLEVPEYNISSTQIRHFNICNCPKPVLDYILEKQIYYYPVLKNYLSDKRLEHSISVANLAYEIAEANGVDKFKAYQAGLIHDIAKDLPQDLAIAMMESHFPEESKNVGKWGYHQFLAGVIAKDVFKIEDKEILDAITYHATGKKDMSNIAKIIYAADKIDPSRGWNSKSLVKLCKKDLNLGFIEVLRDNLKYFNEKGIPYHNIYTDECVKYYLGVE